MFWAFSNTFTCNPKYIALKLAECVGDLDIVWVAEPMPLIKGLPGNIRFVSSHDQILLEIATAKVVVVNVDLPKWILDKYRKRKGQFYINTWHGSLGIKRIGLDRHDESSDEVQRMLVDVKNVDFIPSNSRFETDIFSRRFMGCGVIRETGHPRNDVFFRESEKKLYKALELPLDVKLVMYAPTWRSDDSLEYFDLDPDETVRALEKRFGGRWVFLFRAHPKLREKLRIRGINVSDYPDVQELMADCDALITDYSSLIYDFVLSRRPGFIYAPDHIEYASKRGLYYPLSETPFPIAVNTEEMVQNILGFDNEKYQHRVTEFLKARGCREDGHASERLAKMIVNVVRGEKPDLNSIEQAHTYY